MTYSVEYTKWFCFWFSMEWIFEMAAEKILRVSKLLIAAKCIAGICSRNVFWFLSKMKRVSLVKTSVYEQNQYVLKPIISNFFSTTTPHLIYAAIWCLKEIGLFWFFISVIASMKFEYYVCNLCTMHVICVLYCSLIMAPAEGRNVWQTLISITLAIIFMIKIQYAFTNELMQNFIVYYPWNHN